MDCGLVESPRRSTESLISCTTVITTTHADFEHTATTLVHCIYPVADYVAWHTYATATTTVRSSTSLLHPSSSSPAHTQLPDPEDIHAQFLL